MKQRVAAERKGKGKCTLIRLLDLDSIFMPCLQTQFWLVAIYDWKSFLEK